MIKESKTIIDSYIKYVNFFSTAGRLDELDLIFNFKPAPIQLFAIHFTSQWQNIRKYGNFPIIDS